jgi:alkyl hydroperoxide reductase subunit AhpC
LRAFAEFVGGLSYPLLADFHPKGAVMRQYNVWREDRGHAWRSVYILDALGVIRWSKWIERGAPDIEEVLNAIKAIA